MSVRDNAAAVRLLRDTPIYQEAFAAIKEKQIKIFLKPGSSEDDIKQAHDIICAMEKLEHQLETYVTEEKVLDNKENSAP